MLLVDDNAKEGEEYMALALSTSQFCLCRGAITQTKGRRSCPVSQHPVQIRGRLDVFAAGGSGSPVWRKTVPSSWHARTGLFVPSRRSLYVAVSFHGDQEARIQEYRIE